MDTITQRAALYARKMHAGQKDDSGLDYYLAHVMPVAHIVSMVTHDPQVIAAAYLHDTLEDTNATPYEIQRKFGVRVAGLVRELTHDGNKTNGYTFPRLKSREAILIKFADRLQNLSRMDDWPDRRRAHYIKKSTFWRSK